MPFKSQAQRRKFQELVAKGEMKPEVYQEWENATRGKKLPERITPKKPPRRHKIK